MKKFKNLMLLLFVSATMMLFVSCKKEPEACFTASTTTALSGDSISFTNCSHNGHSYKWDFGDDKISTDENPSHVFNTSGNYGVALTAYSKNGNKSDETILDITINGSNNELLKRKWEATSYYIDGEDEVNYYGFEIYPCSDGITTLYYTNEATYAYEYTFTESNYTCVLSYSSKWANLNSLLNNCEVVYDYDTGSNTFAGTWYFNENKDKITLIEDGGSVTYNIISLTENFMQWYGDSDGYVEEWSFIPVQ